MIYVAEVARKFVIINYKEPHAVIEKLYLSFRTPLESFLIGIFREEALAFVMDSLYCFLLRFMEVTCNGFFN